MNTVIRAMRTPRGVILMITLLVVFFLTLLVTAMLLMSRHNLAFSQVYADRLQGMMAAEAGADYALYRLEGDNTWQAGVTLPPITFPLGSATPALTVLEVENTPSTTPPTGTATGTLADGSTFQITFAGSDYPSKNNLSGDSAQSGYKNRTVPPYCADILVHGWGGNGQGRVVEAMYRKSVVSAGTVAASGSINVSTKTLQMGSTDNSTDMVRSNFPSQDDSRTPQDEGTWNAITISADNVTVASPAPAASPPYKFSAVGKVVVPSGVPPESKAEKQSAYSVPVVSSRDLNATGGNTLAPGVYMMTQVDGKTVVQQYDMPTQPGQPGRLVHTYQQGEQINPGMEVTATGINVTAPQQVEGSIVFVDSGYTWQAPGGSPSGMFPTRWPSAVLVWHHRLLASRGFKNIVENVFENGRRRHKEDGKKHNGSRPGGSSGTQPPPPTAPTPGSGVFGGQPPPAIVPPRRPVIGGPVAGPVVGNDVGFQITMSNNAFINISPSASSGGDDPAVDPVTGLKDGSFADYTATIKGEGAVFADSDVYIQGANYETSQDGNGVALFAGGDINILAARDKYGNDVNTQFKGLLYTRGKATFQGKAKVKIEGTLIAVNPDNPTGQVDPNDPDKAYSDKGNIWFAASNGGQFDQVDFIYNPSFLKVLNKITNTQPLERYYWQDQSSSPKF